MEPLHYTRHACSRMSQRNLKTDDVEFIIKHADAKYRTGVRFYRLRDKDLPDDLPGNSSYRRLVGTTVLVCHCECVITAYRNEQAHKKDRRKPDYDLRGCTDCRRCSTDAA
ncbi:MAG: DUF4258 domain-containing protein [Chloroflexota bacterium]